ncbi:stress-inducible protein STI1, putative [Bodo saltans]|uniref:Stress-inducible protein STI1, putative n=1 Tax=Bodo saltans TaxID=75058 RepID=A0A0S4IP08_BODSA|nr:stress-inducible protein STI1, putative [Bodo saltans]|eukprot:CUE96193.1 stress-inducible protein STI1, putative [Bodo saltans]
MDAAAYKSKGNEAFSAKNYPEAIEYFTKAIELDGSNHVLFSNRSACYASTNQWNEALADAETCVALNATWGKGYVRLGAAQHGLKRFDEAIATYEKGQQVEPTLQALADGIAAAQKDQQASRPDPFAGIFNAGIFVKIQSNPRLAPYLQQPDYVQMLNTIVANPRMAGSFLQDKRFMQTFMELSGIGGFAGGDDADEGDAPRDLRKPTSTTPTPAEAPTPKPAPTSEPPKKAAAAPAAAPSTSDAAKLKEEGNNFYKQRKFDEAMEKYKAAFALEPANTTFLLNQTAVLFEEGKFDECITACDEALEHGRENKADYTVIAKLMTRKAFCLQKLRRHEEAIPLYKKALIEHRNPDTLAKLDACEKEKKKNDIEAYINPELGAAAKEEGNTFFKADKFPEAVAAYTEAIKRNPTEHTAYSNRAAAYLKLGAYNEALEDCEKCLAIKPDFIRAIARKGHAYFWTKQYNKALQAYDSGLKLDATNQECIDGKNKTRAKISEMASGQSGEEGDDAARRAMADPEIAAIMGDSYMQMVLGEMQRDPSRIQDYLRDPGISEKINKLIAAGILRFGDGNGQQQQGGAARRR